jgi:hypothetical protein
VIEEASEHGPAVGNQHDLIGIENLGGLGHEVHATLDDDRSLRLRRLARECEAIADDVGDAVVDFRCLIIVRQDHRAARLLERVDRLHIGREERPLDRWHHGLDALVEVSGLARDLVGPIERGWRQDAKLARRVGIVRWPGRRA